VNKPASQTHRFGPSLFANPILINTLLSLSTAALLLLAFPKFNLHFLAPLSLTPLLIALARTADGWQRFFLGWASGIFFWFFLCTWIQFVLERHGDMGLVGSWACFALFCLLKGLHMAVFAWLAGPIVRSRFAIPGVAALWTGLERTHGTFGFAWLDLGNAAINMSLPLRLAPYVGVYGLSFVLAMLATAAACVLLKQHRSKLLPLMALPLLWLFPKVPEALPANETALVVQPNIDPEAQWTGLAQLQAQQRLSLLSSVFPSPLVIWPELPAPLYFYDDPDFHQAALAVARRGSYFLFGTVSHTKAHEPLNSAVLLKPDGSEVGRYDKIDLVPFGEFVPSLFSFVNRISHETGDFVPGHDIQVMNGTRGDRLGVFICYESAFPDLVRQFSRQGANVLVNLSNDAYFGRSEARVQHLSLVQMRAVETRRFIIRSTNDGITAVVDPAGRVRQRLPIYQEVAAAIHYGVVPQVTFYAEHGDWFAWSCLAVGLALTIRTQLLPRRRRD
jgi:apolipoprotein N-acyltransferase